MHCFYAPVDLESAQSERSDRPWAEHAVNIVHYAQSQALSWISFDHIGPLGTLVGETPTMQAHVWRPGALL